MKLAYDVTYTDGTTEHVKVRPKHLVGMEDAGIKIGESVRSSYSIAHHASERPEPFEEWLELVEEIETITPETVNGSREVPTQEESPTSPS